MNGEKEESREIVVTRLRAHGGERPYDKRVHALTASDARRLK